MSSDSFRGDLAETPFPQVLASIGREERTGVLRVRKDSSARTMAFTKGLLDIEPAAFDDQGFLDWLAALGAALPADLERGRDEARRSGSSLARALIQAGVFPAARLWELIESFTRAEIQAAFNWAQGEYSFEPRERGPETALVRGLPLPGLILEGIRRMANFEIIEKNLPAAGEAVQALGHGGDETAGLAPHERYLLDSAGRPVRVEDLCRTSDLGERETKRVLFSLLALGLLGPVPAGAKNGRASLEYSMGDMDKLFGVFVDRFTYIYKYISKELGPVAPHIVEKALDEVKDRLDPVFRTCEVKPDGRIEIRPTLRKNLGVSSDLGKRSLLRSFDEILAAEVLAVKRNLGNLHEAALVKGMERIGDLR
jgi:hypothetical protein